MHYAYAYLRRCRPVIEHKESMNDILIHTSRLYHKPTNPDKSRPCLTHRRLRLILSDWILSNVVDSEVFRITANACYKLLCPYQHLRWSSTLLDAGVTNDDLPVLICKVKTFLFILQTILILFWKSSLNWMKRIEWKIEGECASLNDKWQMKNDNWESKKRGRKAWKMTMWGQKMGCKTWKVRLFWNCFLIRPFRVQIS